MSSESAFVVNVKTRIGTIITVRGNDFNDLKKNIDDSVLGQLENIIGAFEEAILGDGAAVAYATKSLGAEKVSSTNSFAPVTPPNTTAPAPSCQHGTLVHRTGTGAKGPWQAWMCPLPKERKSEQCEPQWIRKGQPGWVN